MINKAEKGIITMLRANLEVIIEELEKKETDKELLRILLNMMYGSLDYFKKTRDIE